MTKSEHLEWALFAVRLMVGGILILHGAQKILGLLCCSGTYWNEGYGTILCLAPLTEIFGGGLILSGIMVELGTILVVPVILFALIITRLNADIFMQQVGVKFSLNLLMLAIVVGTCGPGKWALWDPGKTLRKKIF